MNLALPASKIRWLPLKRILKINQRDAAVAQQIFKLQRHGNDRWSGHQNDMDTGPVSRQLDFELFECAKVSLTSRRSSMSRRKTITPEQKIAMVRRHLIEKVPVTNLRDALAVS